MNYRPATPTNLRLLAAFNQHLIEDERADTRLSLQELESRMRNWLNTDYQAVIFEVDVAPIGYALFRPEEHGIHLRQFFIARHARRKGLGRTAIGLLLSDILPKGAGSHSTFSTIMSQASHSGERSALSVMHKR
jgi:GNAT superfamily N-acetyltransferase